MKGFKTQIEDEANSNTNFRKVLYTSDYSQLVLMSLLPGEEIGLETHTSNDQFFRIESGHGRCVIDGNEYELHDGDAVVVPSGAEHNIINLSEEESLKLYTIYSPPHHMDGIVRATKADAENIPEEFDGKTTESNGKPEPTPKSSALTDHVELKINSVKLKQIKRKLVKSAVKIAKYTGKIDKLKERMSKLAQAHYA